MSLIVIYLTTFYAAIQEWEQEENLEKNKEIGAMQSSLKLDLVRDIMDR